MSLLICLYVCLFMFGHSVCVQNVFVDLSVCVSVYVCLFLSQPESDNIDGPSCLQGNPTRRESPPPSIIMYIYIYILRW